MPNINEHWEAQSSPILISEISTCTTRASVSIMFEINIASVSPCMTFVNSQLELSESGASKNNLGMKVHALKI